MICPRCHRSYSGAETHCAFDGTELSASPRIDLLNAGKTRHMGAILGDRFEIRGFVGQGGTSRVYLAKDHRSGDPVAVKLLEPPWAHDRVAKERFMQEAEAAARIHHPGVARIIFVGERGNGTPYLAMEFLFGETLETYLKRNQTMEVELLLPVLRELASTLEIAHLAGVIHRDVKPENVFLLGETDEPYGVKLVDFGFAKLRDSTITAAGIAIGSVDYMAPEQCVTDAVDARTDVYGVGMLAFKAMSGRLPFQHAPVQDQLAHNLIAPAPRLVTSGDFDPYLSAVVERCLRKHPRNRYKDMGALLRDLDAIADGQEPEASTIEAPTEDVYIPQGPFAQLATKALYRRLNVPLPAALT